MTQVVEVEVVESSARHLIFRLKRIGGKVAFDVSGATRVWLSADHDDSGDRCVIDVPNTLPSAFVDGVVAVKATRANLFKHLGAWKFHISALIDGEDIPLIGGTINVLDRAADPMTITGSGGLAAAESTTA